MREKGDRKEGLHWERRWEEGKKREEEINLKYNFVNPSRPATSSFSQLNLLILPLHN